MNNSESLFMKKPMMPGTVIRSLRTADIRLESRSWAPLRVKGFMIIRLNIKLEHGSSSHRSSHEIAARQNRLATRQHPKTQKQAGPQSHISAHPHPKMGNHGATNPAPLPPSTTSTPISVNPVPKSGILRRNQPPRRCPPNINQISH